MKIIISSSLFCLSFYIAFIRDSHLKRNVSKCKSLLDFSRVLKRNFEYQMKPLHTVSSDFFLNSDAKNAAFSSPDEVYAYLKENYSTLPFLTDFLSEVSLIPLSAKDVLLFHCEKMIEITEKGLNDRAERYKNDAKNGYILFPGIISIFILVLI